LYAVIIVSHYLINQQSFKSILVFPFKLVLVLLIYSINQSINQSINLGFQPIVLLHVRLDITATPQLLVNVASFL